MDKITSILVSCLIFVIIVLCGFTGIETYEDYIEKLAFSGFYKQTINYYKLNLSFWIDIFRNVTFLRNVVSWYEVFLSTINIISVALGLYLLCKSRYACLIFILAIVFPQFIYLNFTRTAMLAATVAIFGIVNNDKKSIIVISVLMLLIAASIRWQVTIYVWMLMAILFLNVERLKSFIIIIPILAIIPLYLYIDNTSHQRIQFYETEPYLFTLNDANIQRTNVNLTDNEKLIKEMAMRWIIPERKYINIESLNKFTYASFVEQEALGEYMHNFKNKVQKYHNRPLYTILFGYTLLLCPVILLWIFGISNIKRDFIIRIFLSLTLILLVSILVKLELRVFYPSICAIVVFGIHNDIIKTQIQRIGVILLSVIIIVISIKQVQQLRIKLLPERNIAKQIDAEIYKHKAKNIAWDVQSITLNFCPAFIPTDVKGNNFFIEEPYIDIVSQMPNSVNKDYLDFIKYLKGNSILIVDDERFSYVQKYLNTFYNYKLDVEYIFKKEYEINKKINVMFDENIKNKKPYFLGLKLKNEN